MTEYGRNSREYKRMRKVRRNKIITRIAVSLIITSILAGALVLKRLYARIEPTDFDAFLFIYAVFGFITGLMLQWLTDPASDIEEGYDPWWWWWWW